MQTNRSKQQSREERIEVLLELLKTVAVREVRIGPELMGVLIAPEDIAAIRDLTETMDKGK